MIVVYLLAVEEEVTEFLLVFSHLQLDQVGTDKADFHSAIADLLERVVVLVGENVFAVKNGRGCESRRQFV